jgi:transcription antitermination factor NusG
MGLGMAEPCLTAGFRDSEHGRELRRDWLAAYTRAQHEASVARQLQAKQVTFLLPTYSRMSSWSDRRKRAPAPLFPSYVFVHVNHEERVRVLQTAGVVNIVSAAGRPSPLSAEEVAMLHQCALRPRQVEPHPFLQIGQRVRVKQGPFAGWAGVLTSMKNSARLVVSLEQIMRSVAVDLDGADVEPAN